MTCDIIRTGVRFAVVALQPDRGPVSFPMPYAGFMSAAPPSAPPPQEPVEPPQLLQLGLDDDEPCLRADAARNRARLLEAAAGLVAARGADAVTMEEVAAAAGVGKGTVFRRFGDRTGLLMALLDHSEKKLQAAFLGGPRRWARARPGRAAARLRPRRPAPHRGGPGAPARGPAGPGPPLHRPALPGAAPPRRPAAAPGGPGRRLRPARPHAAGPARPALVHHLMHQCGMPARRLEDAWTDLVDRITGTAA